MQVAKKAKAYCNANKLIPQKPIVKKNSQLAMQQHYNTHIINSFNICKT